MRNIIYADSSQVVRLDFPWVGDPSAVSIAATDLGGTALLSATACTILTADSLASAVSSGATTLTLTTGSASIVPGDRFRIGASSTGRAEDIEVLFYNSSTKTITVRESLQYSHASAASVKARFCTYALNASTTTTWYLNLQCSLIWTPTGIDEAAHREMARVVKYSYGLERELPILQALYPDLYRIAEPRIDTIQAEALRRLTLRLKSRKRNIDDLVDQEALQPALLELVALMIAQSGGDEWSTERLAINETYNNEFEQLASGPYWFDSDQDSIEEVTEVDDTTPDFIDLNWN